MPNRTDQQTAHDPARPDPQRRLEQARADLSRMARQSAPGQTEDATSAPVPDATAVAARIDLMRGRLGKAREDAISALLFLGDAQRDCDALAEICAAAHWPLMRAGVDILSDALRRALPSEPHHLDLIGLLIDALYALRRAETRPDMGRAGQDLLHGLRLAVARELKLHHA